MKADKLLLGMLDEVMPGHGLEAVGLEVLGPEYLDDSKALDEKISSWNGTGWIARQSGVCEIVDGQGDDPVLGWPVSAEIVESPKNKSYQIHRMTNGWHITTITEVETEEATHLAETVKHVAKGKRIAVYRRYWSLPDDGASEVIAWRLLKFEEGKA